MPNLESSPVKQAYTTSGKQGKLANIYESPTKNNRLKQAQSNQKEILHGQVNESPVVSIQASVELGSQKANMWHNPEFTSKMDKIQSKIEQAAEEHKVSKASPKKGKGKKARPQSAFPADHPLACEKFPE